MKVLQTISGIFYEHPDGYEFGLTQEDVNEANEAALKRVELNKRYSEAREKKHQEEAIAKTVSCGIKIKELNEEPTRYSWTVNGIIYTGTFLFSKDYLGWALVGVHDDNVPFVYSGNRSAKRKELAAVIGEILINHGL